MQKWQEQAMPVTEVTIKSAIEWVNKLDRMAESSRTGCAEGVLKAMEDESVRNLPVGKVELDRSDTKILLPGWNFLF